METYKQYIGEATKDSKKLFGEYAVGVIANLVKMNDISDEDFGDYVVSFQHSIVKTFTFMGHDTNNPNYKNFVKYMPKGFDKGIFDNNGVNTYDGEWLNMKDAERFTITRKAIKKYAKENSLSYDEKVLVK